MSNAKYKKKTLKYKFIITILLPLIVYIFVVWFLPSLDLTNGLLNNVLDDIAVLIGVDRHHIVTDEAATDDIVFLDSDVDSTQSNIYRVYFSKVYNGDTKQSKTYKYSIDKVLSYYIKNAESEIIMAMYDIQNDTIASALSYAYYNGVDVKLVTESDNRDTDEIKILQDSGIPINFDTNSALMHNKFLVIDKNLVWTGSYNTTDRGSYYNNNNAIIIKSKKLAQYYIDEFEEMFYSNAFGRRSPDDTNPLPKIIIEDSNNAGAGSDIEVEVYFSPDFNILTPITELIGKSKASIYFMAFSFTHEEIATALISKHKMGISVKGIIEDKRTTGYSKYKMLTDSGIDVLGDTNKYNMHNKVMIIDSKYVITGSANFSKNAINNNDENIIIINSESIAHKYIEEFNELFMNAVPVQ